MFVADIVNKWGMFNWYTHILYFSRFLRNKTPRGGSVITIEL